MKINFLLVIVAYLGIACGASQSDYQIGVVLPLTGDFETDGQEAFTVIGLVQHQARTDGLDLSFVVLDNKSDPNQSIECVNELYAGGASMIVGPLYSSNSQAAAEAAKKLGVPMLTPLATLPELNRNNDYVFRACFTDTMQAHALAEYAWKELSLKKMMTVTNLQEAYAVGLSRDFEDRFGKLGGEIVKRVYYRDLLTQAEEVLSDLSSVGADAIFLPGYDDAAIDFVELSYESLGDITLLGSDGWDTAKFRSNIFPAGLNLRMIISNHYDFSSVVSGGDFQEKFFAEFGHDPGQAAALCYDSLRIAVEAVSKTNGDPESVRSYLSELNFTKGVSGTIDFASTNTGNPKKPVVIQEIVLDQDRLPVFNFLGKG